MKITEFVRPALFIASLAIITGFQGWDKVIALAALFTLAFIFKGFLPKTTT